MPDVEEPLCPPALGFLLAQSWWAPPDPVLLPVEAKPGHQLSRRRRTHDRCWLTASVTRLIWEQPADRRALAAPPPPLSGHISSPSEDASDSSCRAKRFGHHRQQCCPTKPASCMTLPCSPPGGRVCDRATRRPRSGATQGAESSCQPPSGQTRPGGWGVVCTAISSNDNSEMHEMVSRCRLLALPSLPHSCRASHTYEEYRRFLLWATFRSDGPGKLSLTLLMLCSRISLPGSLKAMHPTSGWFQDG